MIVSGISAVDARNLPVAKFVIWAMTAPLGVNPRKLRADRILDEAYHTEDPVHLMRVFGISAPTAIKYLHAAHPDRFVTDPTSP